VVKLVKCRASLKDWLPKKKKKKSNRKTLRKQLDKIWAEVVKQRAGNKCERSGKTTYLNSHHIFSRSNLSVRWNLDNGICLNAGWHTLQKESVHKSPIEFIEWLKKERGDKWYNELRLKANQVKKWTDRELELLLETLKEINNGSKRSDKIL